MKYILLFIGTCFSLLAGAQQLYFMNNAAIPYEMNEGFTLDSIDFRIAGEKNMIKTFVEGGLLKMLVPLDSTGASQGDTSHYMYNEQNNLVRVLNTGEDEFNNEIIYEAGRIIYELNYNETILTDSVVYAYDENDFLMTQTSYGIDYDEITVTTFYNDNSRLTGYNQGGYLISTLDYDESGNISRQEIQDVEGNVIITFDFFYTESLVTHTHEVEGLSYKIYPNPVQKGNVLNIESNNNLSWEVFDLTGKRIASGFDTKNNSISTADWEVGMYILVIEENFSKKIIVR